MALDPEGLPGGGSVALEPGFRVAVVGGFHVVADGLPLREGGTGLAGEDREEALGLGDWPVVVQWKSSAPRIARSTRRRPKP
ncbi:MULTISPECIES: hypothetical protein [Streptomyces]|uniref:Uncharacterized protein n=1 Tax=Streptomyces dengpaensis TaxID=2049881 RepID=A0ABN5ICP8_9ACTN|nr:MULTISPECIES: hypothetical protein [Streptomyces]AVH60759.1 hypothetical protein C4B68_39020 [Streptomyces dengpaensis]